MASATSSRSHVGSPSAMSCPGAIARSASAATAGDTILGNPLPFSGAFADALPA
jgi:hypothetical protein